MATAHRENQRPLMRCSENRFCASLEPKVRSRLCAICVKSTYAAGSHVSMDFYKHFLVIEGLCMTRYEQATFIYRPGDFVVTPHADASRSVSLADVSFDNLGLYGTDLEFIHFTTLAYFDKAKIDELLEDPGFLRASYDNLKDFYAHLVAFFIGMNKSSAYEAVRFLLRYCEHNGVGHLTHEQIAKITGHSRTTVTGIMHQIALAEPELLQ